MDIHEYQAKALLKRYGIPVAEGVVVSSVHEVDSAIKTLPGGLYVVKSQIHAGGRGKGRFRGLPANSRGGVRLEKSIEGILSDVREMLGSILVTKQTGPAGSKVNCLYIEDGADILKELYLSLLVDRVSGKISFVASTQGGMDIEEVAKDYPQKIFKLPIDSLVGVTPKDISNLCDMLELKGQARIDAESLFPNLYKAFCDKDMSLLEINPLIIMQNGRLRVLDSKVSFDDNALYRHLDIQELHDDSGVDVREIEARKHGLSYITLDGNIGCMVNGAGLAMATMDIIKLYGGEPANFLDVGGGTDQDKVAAAFKIIMLDSSVKGILINIFGGIVRCDVLVKGILSAVKDVNVNIPLVMRLEGAKVDIGNQLIVESGLNVITAIDLDDAAQKIVRAVKGV
ncbi:succinyl-CoA synthetase subunit beta [Candidatus Liberibacter solanacearum]|uniref:Succinate--CoA ligase [ADP-forming] subunit beta n=1 Tax=Candidatus Liberibacter solanacearum TaxID=556287 RepID=A0A094Z0X4_9HYPH|nr:ADP-forming succinate--CoA ligase subunit beta [Candidatus Liberibacter solanacearum]KGB27247.1 succinyl-CoA synthetase subunit beta [Candidatus Liberibacter solanacearum]KJZ81428.1 succinyl-CoA synthetase subunit beta [Candidatus Liberibacter solanacearum]KJZ82557.1 Succinyl-CoA ligase [ADP-forming] beta chain [Candidatus Liberibacter solanacearum]KQC49062.1 succinyl-CoA synthetase subunit beta [Candidatus Liberibacter solanacearum]